PRLEVAPAWATRCPGEPRSSGAASRPSHCPKSRGDTASAPTSSAGWETNTTSSRKTKARLALKARRIRWRSPPGCDAGLDEVSIPPAWRRPAAESTGPGQKEGRGNRAQALLSPAGREGQVERDHQARARAAGRLARRRGSARRAGETAGPSCHSLR